MSAHFFRKRSASSIVQQNVDTLQISSPGITPRRPSFFSFAFLLGLRRAACRRARSSTTPPRRAPTCCRRPSPARPRRAPAGTGRPSRTLRARELRAARHGRTDLRRDAAVLLLFFLLFLGLLASPLQRPRSHPCCRPRARPIPRRIAMLVRIAVKPNTVVRAGCLCDAGAAGPRQDLRTWPRSGTVVNPEPWLVSARSSIG